MEQEAESLRDGVVEALGGARKSRRRDVEGEKFVSVTERGK